MTLLDYTIRIMIALEENDIPVRRKFGYEFVITNPHTNDTRIELWPLEKLDRKKEIQLDLIRIGTTLYSDKYITQLIKRHNDIYFSPSKIIKPPTKYDRAANSGIKHVRKARGLPKRK